MHHERPAEPKHGHPQDGRPEARTEKSRPLAGYPPGSNVSNNAKFFWLFLAIVLTALILWLQIPTTPVKTPPEETPPPPEAIAEIPAAKFTDVTASAGLTFVHHNGAYGEKLLPESMGGGCAFLDYDNDGDQDILFVNSGDWPWHKTEGKKTGGLVLCQNDSHGRFSDVSAGANLVDSYYGMGVAAGDSDNDGWVDLFVTAVGGNRLFRNLGNGTFAEVTAQAGLASSPEQWSTSCAWIDYDNDGDLDLFVCNYVRWSREIDQQADYRLSGIGRAYGPPLNFSGVYPYLYRNDSHGRFTDVSDPSGMHIKNKVTGSPLAKSLGVAPVDLDGDGWMDLVVANDTVQNFVFHNERNGTFKEIGALSGIAYDPFGSARGAMGIDSGRFQDDNTLGISIGNFANEMTALYVSQQDPLFFSDEAIQQGIGHASRVYLTFGVFFFDYDLDGWLDLLTANGHLEPDINKIHPSQRYAQPAQLFWNVRGSRKKAGFVSVPPEKCGADILQPIVGRGSAYADMDGDGDLDVLLAQIGGPPLLLRNDQKLKRHWLRFKLTGTTSNRDAIGAWVKVRVGNKTFSQQVMPTRGYLSQSELPVTIGLGEADHVDDVEVTWPGGAKEKIHPVRLDALTMVRQSR